MKGYRLVVAFDKASGARLWSRQGKELTDRFPDIAARGSGHVDAMRPLPLPRRLVQVHVSPTGDCAARLARFPAGIAAAPYSLRPQTVVDGEVVMGNGDRLDFDLLLRRVVTHAQAAAAAMRRQHPASYVAFDLLANAGLDGSVPHWLRRFEYARWADETEHPPGYWPPDR